MTRAILKGLTTISVIVLGYSIANCEPIQTGQVVIEVSPSVELVSIIFRLAGNGEYNVLTIPSYDQDVKKHFEPFIDHPAVQFAAELAKKKGIGFDGPIWMAIQLANGLTPRKDIRFPQNLVSADKRWSTEDAKKFATLAEKFAKDTRFQDFFAQHKALYATAETRMRDVLEKDVRLTWFQKFFGKQAGTTFYAIPGMLTGDQSYGPSIKTTDGRRDVYAILTIYSGKQELPDFSEEARHIIAHEFIHSYTNPLVDKFASKLEPSGEKLFSRTSDLMKRQNYGNWKALMYESLNRACGIRYTFATKGPEAAYQLSKQERERGFYWVPGLADLLEQYDRQPREYKDLTQFFPKIIDYLNNYSNKAGTETKK